MSKISVMKSSTGTFKFCESQFPHKAQPTVHMPSIVQTIKSAFKKSTRNVKGARICQGS